MTASAATGAVSVRSTLGPSVVGMKVASTQRVTSAGDSPPSGPISREMERDSGVSPRRSALRGSRHRRVSADC